MSPADSVGSTPPAALVTISVRTPSAADDADAEADLAGRVAFVAVNAPAQQQRGLARDRAGDEAAGVAGDGRLGKAGQRRVGDAARALQAIGDAAQARTRAPPRRRRRRSPSCSAAAWAAPLHAIEKGRIQLHGGARLRDCVRRTPSRRAGTRRAPRRGTGGRRPRSGRSARPRSPPRSASSRRRASPDPRCRTRPASDRRSRPARPIGRGGRAALRCRRAGWRRASRRGARTCATSAGGACGDSRRGKDAAR